MSGLSALLHRFLLKQDRPSRHAFTVQNSREQPIEGRHAYLIRIVGQPEALQRQSESGILITRSILVGRQIVERTNSVVRGADIHEGPVRFRKRADKVVVAVCEPESGPINRQSFRNDPLELPLA